MKVLIVVTIAVAVWLELYEVRRNQLNYGPVMCARPNIGHAWSVELPAVSVKGNTASNTNTCELTEGDEGGGGIG